MTATAEDSTSSATQYVDDHVLIVSSDGHAMAEMADYKPYLAQRLHAAFDEFLVRYAEHGLRSSDPEWLSNRLDPEEVERWQHDVVDESRLAGDSDPMARIAEMDRDGRTAEILFPDFGRPFELGTPIRESLLGYERNSEHIAAELPACRIPDVGKPDRIERVQHRHLAMGVPPLAGKPGEAVDLGIVDRGISGGPCDGVCSGA